MRLHSAQSHCNLQKLYLLRPCSKEASTLLGQTLKKTVEGFIRNWPILSLQSRNYNRAVMLVDKTKQNKNTFVLGGRKTLSFLSTKMVP